MAKNGQKKVELSKVLYYIYSLITLTVGLVGWVGGLVGWVGGLVKVQHVTSQQSTVQMKDVLRGVQHSVAHKLYDIIYIIPGSSKNRNPD